MALRFDVEPTPISGVAIVHRKPIADERGMFARLFCDDTFSDLGLPAVVRQINQSLTHRRGAVRGMHFQYPPFAEGKVVSCLSGEVFDVAVDLRRGSSTFLRWHGRILSAHNLESLYVPPGCAHGFQTLADDCELLYLHSEPYHPEADGAVSALDPAIGIDWPLPVTEMSDRDRSHAYLTASFGGLDI